MAAKDIILEPRRKFNYSANPKVFYDMIVVGAGVVGLATGMYAGRLGLKILIIGELQGGTITLTKSVENSKNCKKRIRNIAFWTYCALVYPLNYMSMDNGWGFYEENPKVTIDTSLGGDGESSHAEIMVQRMILLLTSPLTTPVNGLYMVVESVTNIE